MAFLIKWLILTVSVMAAAYIIPGMAVRSFGVALIAALILGLVNIFIKPILVVLTLPITVVTLGLFLLVINALMLYLVGALVKGFVVTGFFPALFGSILISIVSWALTSLIGK